MADSDGTAPSASPDCAPPTDMFDVSTEGDEPSASAWSELPLEFGADGLVEARHFVKRVATAAGATPAVVFDAQLAVSELATNALHHGEPPALVRALCDEDGLLIEVSDRGPGLPTPRRSGPHDASGRGLHIVSSVASEWGADARGAGKSVWCRFRLQ